MQSLFRIEKKIARFLPSRLKRLLRQQPALAKYFPPPYTRPATPSITIEFAAWSVAHPEFTHQVLRPAQNLEIVLPHTIEPEIHPDFEKRKNYHVKAKMVSVLPHTKLVGKEGMVILPDGSFSAEIANGHEILRAERAFRKPLPTTQQFKPGKYFSFMMRWASGGNYYHWLHDILPKAYLVLDILPPDTKFIVPAKLEPFQRETLQILGVVPEQCEPYDGTEMWELQEQYFSIPTTWSGYDLPEADRWLRDKILSTYGIKQGLERKRIYIDRQNARARRVSNIDAVKACLCKCGFEAYQLERLDFRAQVELFAQAEFVVSPHGAGLTNLLFAPPDTGVIEFFTPPHFNIGFWSYWMMSTTLGQDYSYLLGDAMPNPYIANHNDIFVPMDKLERTLYLTMERQAKRRAH